jgi:N-acyl amino acid synthase of PEP-CTERM/exosortase system
MLNGGLVAIAADYERHFDVIRAATSSLLREAYRLRYQVYCVENRFENPDQQIGAYESDDDDDRSVHTLLMHRRTGEIVGTSRVILPDQQRYRPLPMATLLQGHERCRFHDFPLAHTAEISRFAVSKEFRRRRNEERRADSSYDDLSSVENERRLMPFITLGLLRGVIDICLEYKISHLAAVMEPPLVRILHRLGLHFAPMGGTVMHHGVRQPCFALLNDLFNDSWENDSIVWQYAMEPLLREMNDPRCYAVPERVYRVAV